MKILVGNAPCSWGALEFEGLEGEKAAAYKQVLDEIAETGYQGTELGDWGFMPTDPAALRAELQARDLVMLGAFVPVRLKDAAAHAEGEAVAVRTAQLLADVASAEHPPFLVLADDNGTDPQRTKNAGRVTAQLELSAQDWKTFGQGVGHIARAVSAATGLRTAFHHHCAGYVETPNEIQRLMDITDPLMVGLVLDTGHCAYGAGGGDVALEILHRFSPRIWHVHFKDCEPNVAMRARAGEWDYFEAVRHGVFCELGKGCVDFPAVLATLRNLRYAGCIVVEQDVLPGMGSPKESAQRNRDYLRQIGLV